ncbi:hypothetical protein KCU61_g319, partial [Aureobasidium melanogenum]
MERGLPLARERVSSDWPFDRRARRRTAARQRNRLEVKERRDSRWRLRAMEGMRGDGVGEGVVAARRRCWLLLLTLESPIIRFRLDLRRSRA